ncbi:MAG: bifunctional glutamate N-acetyltransferase/amino-acid acetyltransferase ArgJ [Actinobacteria bacterium]|nr:MAG: bifunctional glutamate N-acetyltransferase/amino-acid acetyltransferase ArgJ [Actinomycetota bacterium]
MEVFNRFIAPKGFKFGAAIVGIKTNGKDLGLMFSDQPCKSAVFFTTNKVQAAPVQVSKEHQKAMMPQAIVVNSGNANAATGKKGLKDATKMAQTTAKSLGIDEKSVLVASTGLIGEKLPMKKVEDSIKKVAKELSFAKGADVAQAIMTTDKATKQVSVQFDLDGKLITLSGIAKGSGMIAPKMMINEATMLAFIFTDLRISQKTLYKILPEINEKTFNSITVDGDTSTNDMVVICANSIAGNKKIGPQDKNLKTVAKAFETVFSSLAKQIVKDGEGASKLLEIKVKGANNDEEANMAAYAIANSNLVKTAFFGERANWGRILAAAGYSGAEFDPQKVSLKFNGLELVKGGVAVKVDKRKLKPIMQKYNIKVELDLKQGKGKASYKTTDLTSEYIKINAEHRT